MFVVNSLCMMKNRSNMWRERYPHLFDSTSSPCNRLCSNISYCSADDSGMSSSNGCSNSDNGAGNTRLEALREGSEEKLQSFEKAAPVKCESAYSQIEDGEARYEYDTGFQIEILKVY